MKNMPNILILTVDCLRPDHLGIYGYKLLTSPVINNLAKKGIIFENAFTAGPNTPPSFNSLFTSTLPFSGESYHPMPNSKIPLALLFRQNGFNTIGINTNDYLKRMFNYHKGFNIYRDITHYPTKYNEFINKYINYLKYRKFEGLALFINYINDMIIGDVRPYISANIVVNELINELEHTDEPFFAWAHFMDTHLPRIPHNQELNDLGLKKINKFEMASIKKRIEYNNKHSNIFYQKLINIYDSNIKYIDNQIRRLLTFIEKHHPNTIIVFTADHGEEFKEHSHFGHYGKLYDELIHIPLIIKGPEIPGGIRENRMFSNIDLAPSLCSLYGFKPPHQWEGRSLDFSFSTSLKWRDYVISQVEMKSIKAFGEKAGTKITSLRTKKYKLIASVDNDITPIEFYDLESDPKETTNLLENKREIPEKMKRIIESLIIKQRMNKSHEERQKLKGAFSKLKREVI